MKTNSIGHWIVALTLNLLASHADAGELKSGELNYAITVPDGCTPSEQADDFMKFVRQDCGSKTLGSD